MNRILPNRSVVLGSVILIFIFGVVSGGLAGTVAATEHAPADPDAVLDDLEGDGSESNPYLITNVTELQAMSAELDSHYKLANDIDAAPTREWNDKAGFEPVGDCHDHAFSGPCQEDTFTGSFDGDGHTIDGLYLNHDDSIDVALFGGVTAGTIENVHLMNVDITSEYPGDGGFTVYTGGLVGYNLGGEIQNVSVEGSIVSENNGGMIVGANGGGTIRNASSSGSITGEEAHVLGGIAGYNRFITQSWERATVEHTYANSTVVNHQIADESSHFQPAAGGLVGLNDYSAAIRNSSAVGAVSGAETAGGVVGVYLSGEIENVFAGVELASENSAGGVVGTGDTIGLASTRDYPPDNDAVIENSYWDEDAAGTTDTVGTDPDPADDNLVESGVVEPVAADDVRGPTAYTTLDSFDFETVWAVSERGYPQIRSLIDVGSLGLSIAAEDVTVPIGGTEEITITAIEAGEPAAGVDIESSVEDSNTLELSSTSVTTDESGQATVEVEGFETGTHTVTVEDESGEAIDTAVVAVSDPEAVAAASHYTPNLNESGTTQVIELFANRSEFSGEAAVEWEIDGEQIGSGMVAETTFTEPGETEITMHLEIGGEAYTDNVTIDVADSIEPTAELEAPTTVPVGESATLNASNSTDNINVTRYEWAFGNDSTASGENLTTPNVSYEKAGSYEVSLTAVDASNNADTTTATVVATAPNASIESDPVEFGNVGLGSNATKTVAVENVGTAPLDVTAVEIDGENASAFENTSLDSVSEGTEQSVGVVFDPAAITGKQANLTIETNASFGDDEIEIQLTGAGVESDLQPETATQEFGTVDIGNDSKQNVTINNTGGADADLTAAEIRGDGFEIPEQTLPTVESDDDANLTVKAAPQAVGETRATLIVESANDHAQVVLTADGVGPNVNVGEPASTPTVGTASENTTNQTVPIENLGNRPLEIDTEDSEIDSTHFEIVSVSETLIEPEKSTTVTFNFTDPGATGTYNGTLNLAHNDSTVDNVSAVQLTGEAEPATYYIEEGDNVDFGAAPQTASNVEQVTVRNKNASQGPVNITNVTVTGSNDAAFEIKDKPASPIEAGEAGTIEVNLTETADDQHAQLQIDTEYATEPRKYVYLTADGAYVNVKDGENTSVNIEGGGPINGTTHEVSVAMPSTDDDPVAFDELELTAQDGFETVVNNTDSVPAGPPDSDENIIQYVQLDHSDHDPAETFDDTAVSYAVDSDAIPEDADAADVVLERYDEDDEAWASFEPDSVKEVGDRYLYSVDTPGFSQFAVTVEDDDETDDDETDGEGASGSGGDGDSDEEGIAGEDIVVDETDSATVAVVDATLDAEEVTEDDPVTVTVIVENRGETATEQSISLTADGTVVATESVSLDAGERVETSLSFEPQAGEYDLAVDETSAGTVTVTSVEQLSAEQIWPELPIIALVILSLFAVWRRYQSE